MAYPKNQAYRDTVEIAKAALSGNDEKCPWLTDDRQDSVCDFIQKVYDKLCSIAIDADQD